MKSVHVFVILLIALSNIDFCMAGEPDALCSEIKKFANKAETGSTLSVELVTEWGEEISTGCLHTKNKAEINFCNFLGKNTSIEFQEINISRALACIGASPIYSEKSNYNVQYGTGKYIAREIPGIISGIEVEITYSFGIKNELPRLIFSAVNTNKKK